MDEIASSYNLIATKLVMPNQAFWQEYTSHEFVEQLATGQLPIHCFKHYLQQDYLFLKHYARAYALAIYKSESVEQMALGHTCLQNLLGSEIQLHLNYCQQWGLDIKAIESLEEDIATVAYTRFVLDRGLAGDLLDLYVALAPCALGYSQIGKRLFSAKTTKKAGNDYWSWIEAYASEGFFKAVDDQMLVLEKLLMQLPLESPRWKQLQHTFATATKLESAFWQQGLLHDAKRLV